MTDPSDKKQRETDYLHYRGVLNGALARFHLTEGERMGLTEKQMEERKATADEELLKQAKDSPRARGLYGDPSAMVNKRRRAKRKPQGENDET